ncbi:MAG: hypothetical protein ABJB11_12545 [Ferruginibacter sp.]
MDKYLLIITRTTDIKEFTDFWLFKKSEPKYFTNGGYHVLLLNGKDYAVNKATYKVDAIKEVVLKFLPQNIEIGVLYHNTKKTAFETQLKEILKDISISFIKTYSSTENSFFDEEGKENDFARPLNKLCEGVKNGLKNESFKNGVDAVWKYKAGDDLLEAKLELLCLLAKENGNNANVIWEKANEVATLEKYANTWENYLKNKNLNALSKSLFDLK